MGAVKDSHPGLTGRPEGARPSLHRGPSARPPLDNRQCQVFAERARRIIAGVIDGPVAFEGAARFGRDLYQARQAMGEMLDARRFDAGVTACPDLTEWMLRACQQWATRGADDPYLEQFGRVAMSACDAVGKAEAVRK